MIYDANAARNSGVVLLAFASYGNKAALSGCLDVGDGNLAGPTVLLRIEGHLLTFNKAAHSGTLEGGCVDEHVVASAIGGDEAEALCFVVEFYSSVVHEVLLGKIAHEPTRAQCADGLYPSNFGGSERPPGKCQNVAVRLSGQVRCHAYRGYYADIQGPSHLR